MLDEIHYYHAINMYLYIYEKFNCQNVQNVHNI